MAVRKQRLDKYYNLAKEKGYRARSAFKLLELNRKYNFLANAHIAVDLCAAPGGWMQILVQEMPAPRKIIGIDLDPIRPLGGDTISFTGDITTIDCRKSLIKHLEGHQADVFVHDGAPNFGTSKDRDVYVQNELVLHALKLATEFLKEGGIFVTKIFRSANFFKITKVLEQLFVNVDITKPLSSRDESAEIFAVCRHFNSPEYIDPSLFDPEVLFLDDSEQKDDNAKILLSDFVKNKGNKFVAKFGKIVVDFECDLITEEFIEMFKDIKLLHDTDLKKIYRLKSRIIKGVVSGKYEIPLLDDLVPKDDQNETDQKHEIQTAGEKIEEINRMLKKSKTKPYLKGVSNVTTARCGFFEDRIFEDFDSAEFEPDACANPEMIEEEESDATCSDSIELSPSELRCAVMMKEMGDRFVEATVDRNMIDSDDLQLPFEQRPIKFDEFNNIPKKKREFIGRKKTRAMRRANKAMEEIEVENEEEEAVIHKKIYKNMYKKQRARLNLVFANRKGGRFRKPKGKGKTKCLDRRMKHDLRIEKQRARRR